MPRRGRRTVYLITYLQLLIFDLKLKSGPKSGPVEIYTTVFDLFYGDLREILVPRRGLELSRIVFNYRYLISI